MDDQEARFRIRNHISGAAASFCTFSIAWPLDVCSTRMRFYPNAIFEGGIKKTTINYLNAISLNHQFEGAKPLVKSFLNIGFYWGFLYTLLAGALTFPLQKEFELHLIENTNSLRYINRQTVQSFAGWLAAFIQLTVLHPIDSLKVIAQKNPDLLNNQSKQYFLSHQQHLRRGAGIVALGSVSHFIAWQAKLFSKERLSRCNTNQRTCDLYGALIFSITHMTIAFPVNTIKTWVQGDVEFNAKNNSLRDKVNRNTSLAMNNIKNMGVTSLYRGFFSRGLMHTSSFALNMYIYDSMHRSK